MDIDRTMEFILKQQAKFEENFGRIDESFLRADERFTKSEKAWTAWSTSSLRWLGRGCEPGMN
jgi:hypothetical protein